MRVMLSAILLHLACGGLGAMETVFPGADWEVAAPDSVGLDAARLAAATAWLSARTGDDGVRQLGIVRHGRLVWQGDRIDAVHGVWSLTKSFTSTALGLLIDEGNARSRPAPRTSYPPWRRAIPKSPYGISRP